MLVTGLPINRTCQQYSTALGLAGAHSNVKNACQERMYFTKESKVLTVAWIGLMSVWLR